MVVAVVLAVSVAMEASPADQHMAAVWATIGGLKADAGAAANKSASKTSDTLRPRIEDQTAGKERGEGGREGKGKEKREQKHTTQLAQIQPLMVPREQLRLHRLDHEQKVAVDLQARRVRRA